MTDWPVKTLGEVARFDSETAKPEDLSSKDVYVGLENITSDGMLAGLGNVSAETLKSNKARFTDKHILFGKLRPYLVKVVRPDFSGVCSTDILPINPSAELSRDYLYWYMRSPAVIEAATEASTGTTLPRVSPTILKSFEIPVPPLEEQKRIVALLDAATACVTELTACYEQARTFANNLFTSALRDALEGNPDWPVKTLGEVCEVFDDGDWIESKDQASSGVRLIQTGNVGDGEFKDRSEKARFISESTFSRLRCTEIFPGDLLVSRLPDPVGRACLIPDTGSKMITAVDCTIMRPRKDMMLPQFLVSLTQTSAYREQVRAKITGTTRDRISRSNLAEVKVSVPPLEEQKRIVARLDEMKAKTSEMVTAYDAKLTAVKNLRQSILEAAFAGDL